MNSQEFKRKLTAVFSADVVGYSRLMGEDEAATVKTLETYKQIMFSLIKQHRGRVIDSPGDNLLAEFASVVDAVQCGVAVQKELQARNAELPENRKMLFRIGINLGDVIEEQDRIYGDGVNIAARLESCADPGGICVSKTAFDHIETKLPLGYEYLGEKEVKNIAKPVGAYRVLMEPRVTVAGARVRKTPAPLRLRKGVLIGAVAVLVLIAGVTAWRLYFRLPPIEPASVEKMAHPLPDKPSIAVLPFANMSEEEGQDFFCDGITEEIITALSKTLKMFVIARNSTFTYKGKAVKVSQVAEELGVRYVLEGSVRKAGDRVRITAQLIDALTGRHLWAERYDRDLKDVFALQDEITIKILSALQLKLTEGEIARINARGTQNLEAYLKVLQAQDAFFTVTKEGMAQTRRLAEEAIALDPEYAVAYAWVGTTHWMEVLLGASEAPKESLKLAFKFLEKAKAMRDSLPISQLGYLYFMTKQYDKGIAECERAVDLDPNSGKAHIWLALVLHLSGKHDEAVRHAEQGLRLDPLGPAWYLRVLGTAYSWVGRYEEAIAAFKNSMRRAPNDSFTHLNLTTTYIWAGRLDDAHAQVDEVLRINPKYSVEQAAKTANYRNQADRERYLDALRKAGLPETPPLPLPDKPSIAVLPFVNMSDDKSQEYFSDGLTEEIITALSKTPKLFVIARNSTFVYKGKPVNLQQVSRELGVKYVLEGSVRRSGDQLRITAQLIDATTGYHLWAEQYDREMKDIFALQDEITMKVINALQVELTEGEHARLWGKGTNNLQAYIKSLRARELYMASTKESNALSRRLAEEAIALDPEFPPPYHFLAVTHLNDVLLGTTKSPKESLARAVELTQKAISLDDSYAVGHGFLGLLYTMLRKPEEGVVEAEKGVALDPNGAHGYLYLSTALRLAGKFEEAVQPIEKAIRLNPFPPVTYFRTACMAYIGVGRYEKAIGAGKRAISVGPDDYMSHTALTAAYSFAGRVEEARSAAEELLRVDPKFSINVLEQRLAQWNKEFLEQFLAALRKAGLK